MNNSFWDRIQFICGYIFYGRCRMRKFITGLICFSLVILFNVKFNKPVFHSFKNKDIKSACVIPKFDIHHSSISDFFWEVNPIKCKSSEPLMYIDSEGLLQINRTVMSANGYTSLKCVCQPVVRINDEQIKFGDEIPCTDPVYISSDFIYARCTDHGQDVYSGLQYGIDYRSTFIKKTFKNESDSNLSVYLFGYDALSNLIARRKMPLTIRYLEDVLEAYTFNGYAKVGDNTWPNLAALLTGYRPQHTKTVLNEGPFIWKNFSREGYVTMFSEDYPILSPFLGFADQPTEHYMNTFFVAADKIQPVTDRDVRKVLLFMEYKNLKVGDSSYLCVGNTPKHKILIEYYKRFIEVYKNHRKFGMSFNTELGHDYINFYQLADKDSMEFLQWMYEKKKLENAILVFYSDHGPRYSEIQNTNIGRVTSLMPIFSIYVPKHIKEKYPHIHENLQKNTERLTTAFDVYETLQDVLNSKFEHTERVDEKSRGISLFRPIPEKRSCFDADIPEHYCPCYASESVDLKSKRVQIMANALVSKLNKLLERYSDRCSVLVLKSVVKASIVKSNFERDKSMEERFSIRSYIYSSTQDNKYLLVIETSPGDAKFEATVHYVSDSDVEISGDISGINRYGDQSKCIDEKTLKLYCFCK